MMQHSRGKIAMSKVVRFEDVKYKVLDKSFNRFPNFSSQYL